MPPVLEVNPRGYSGHPEVELALLRLYRASPTFESKEHARRWLLRVAVNESRRLVCSPWFHRRVPLEEYAQSLGMESPQETGLFQR